MATGKQNAVYLRYAFEPLVSTVELTQGRRNDEVARNYGVADEVSGKVYVSE